MQTIFPEQIALSWRAVTPGIAAAIDAAFARWVGTPFAPGQRCRGAGADCVQQVAGLLDDLFRVPPGTSIIPRLPPDAGLHDARKSWPVIKALRLAHYGSHLVRNYRVEPGDVIVTKSTSIPGSPRRQSHLMMVGTKPFQALHTTPAGGSHITSLEATHGILRIYRPRRKDLWHTSG